MTEDTKQLESLSYMPAAIKSEVHDKPCKCAKCRPKTPIVIIDQIEGCVKIITQLLDELRKAFE